MIDSTPLHIPYRSAGTFSQRSGFFIALFQGRLLL
jgi:hypothetical protein